jgi:MoaA/NifB/PqqE/SkfB family radical SAM enzyme
MRLRYETFGGIIAIDDLPATVYVDRAYMRELGCTDSPLWRRPSAHLSAPITAHFAITRRCPMGCQTRSNSSGSTSSEEPSTTEAKEVLNALAKMRVFTVAFGGGEPLARSDIFEPAAHARTRDLTPTMTTNGSFVDAATARRCRVFGCVHSSLEGVHKTCLAARGADG